MPLLTTLSAREALRPSSAWTGWGQWLALMTMTVDHVTRYLLPAELDIGWASSSIGRIAFPLFAAMVAWHGLFNTRSPLRYARRILVIGLVAQLPYMTMPRDGFQLNICFTLAAGLCWGALLHELLRRANEHTISPWLLPIYAFAMLIVWVLLGPWVEYGHLGLLVIPCFMLALQALNQPAVDFTERLVAATAALPILIVAGMMNSSDMAKSFTVATCLVILLLGAGVARRIPALGVKMPRRLWLSWYPGHFAVIAVLLHWPS